MENPRLCKSIEYLVQSHGPIEYSSMRIARLLYLADQCWFKNHGTIYTEVEYRRWNNGPYSWKIFNSIEWMLGVEIQQAYQAPLWLPNPPSIVGRFSQVFVEGPRSRLIEIPLDPEFQMDLDQVANQWRSKTLDEIGAFIYEDADFKRTEFGDLLLKA